MTDNRKNSASLSSLTKVHRIVLWGPTGVGKDWLFRAFAKELEFYNLHDSRFRYELFERMPGQREPQPTQVEIPIPFPSIATTEYSFIFRRRDFRDGISQEHNLIISINNAFTLIRCLDDPASFPDALRSIRNSDSTFLVLEPPFEEGMQKPEEQPFVDSLNNDYDYFYSKRLDFASLPNWNRKTYLKYIQLLLEVYANEPRRNIAICMTKMDRLRINGTPQEIFEQLFGPKLNALLELHSRLHNINFFSTSAVGFINKDGLLIPNIQDGYILYPDQWDPINVAAPFFWIFEQIERARLEQSPWWSRNTRQKAYIPYPLPRRYQP